MNGREWRGKERVQEEEMGMKNGRRRRGNKTVRREEGNEEWTMEKEEEEIE
jgi:hypothetical protein